MNSKKTPHIFIDNVSKSLSGKSIVSNLTLKIYKSELFSLLGESGCGKSTILRLIAGLDKVDSGKIFINNVDVTNIPPHERSLNMMFQSYALFPHMNVYENISFALCEDSICKKKEEEKVDEMLRLVKMQSKKYSSIDKLSGGEKQRVALARCLIKKPQVLLLDEPLAALDKNLKESTQIELCNIQEKIGTTFIMVTHDQEEAMTMSSRIGILKDGKIEQIGSPSEIYESPNSIYTSKFIGSINIFEGSIEESKDYTIINSPDVQCKLRVKQGNLLPNQKVYVLIRPEKIIFADRQSVKNIKYNCVEGIVEDIVYLGDMSIYYIILPCKKIIMASQTNTVRISERKITYEDRVHLFWKEENTIVLHK